MKLNYSEEEASLTRPHRQDTGQDVWGWVWMQWLTVTF